MTQKTPLPDAYEVPQVIQKLVAKFADHQETYQRGDYNETQPGDVGGKPINSAFARFHN